MAWIEREGKYLYVSATAVSEDRIADAFKEATLHALDEYSDHDGYEDYVEGALQYASDAVSAVLEDIDSEAWDAGYAALTDYFNSNPPEKMGV